MVEGDIYLDGATTGRRDYQGARIIIRRVSCKRRYRNSGIPNDGYAERRLDQRRTLLERRVRRGERVDRVLPRARAKRKTGSCYRRSDQRVQPAKNRRLDCRAEGREIVSQRTFAVLNIVASAVGRCGGNHRRTADATSIQRRDELVSSQIFHRIVEPPPRPDHLVGRDKLVPPLTVSLRNAALGFIVGRSVSDAWRFIETPCDSHQLLAGDALERLDVFPGRF